MKCKSGFTPLEPARVSNGKRMQKWNNYGQKLSNKRIGLLTGFTLIELMIVVVIIAVLAAAVIPRLAGRTQQARNNTAKMDISGNISVALDLYELDNGRYPSSEQQLGSLITKPSSSPVPTNWNGPYLKRKPIDPWGTEYRYACPGTHNNDYDLWSIGPDATDGTSDDITNWDVEATS